MDCPHCGTKLAPELTHCIGCGWKIRLSEILTQPLRATRLPHPLPASDVYYLFADRFLEAVTGGSPTRPVEELMGNRLPVRKEPLVLGLCRVAFIWLAVSGHVELRLAAKPLAFARPRTVIARPKGIYKVPTGSLEGRILDGLYDRRQGLSVDELMVKLIGFWCQGDSYNWLLQVVKQHLLSSPYAPDGQHIDIQQLTRLEPQVEDVRRMLDDFAFAQPALVAALWDSIQRGLDSRRE